MSEQPPPKHQQKMQANPNEQQTQQSMHQQPNQPQSFPSNMNKSGMICDI